MKYDKLVETYEKLESTSKRLEKTQYIAELLKKTHLEDLPIVSLLLQGRIFPKWDERKIGVASRLVLKAIALSTGNSPAEVEKRWSKLGDLGLVAEEMTKKKKQATLFQHELTISKVFNNLIKLPSLEGHGSVDRKIKLISELLTSAKPLEAKYIVRTILEELRIGVGEGSLRDAIVWAYFGDKLGLKFDKKENKVEFKEERKTYTEHVDAVEQALDLTNDFSVVAKTAKKSGLEGLKKISLAVGTPIKVMLFQKVEDIEEAFERVGKPAAFEYKYDGFRLEIHRDKDKIRLLTRRLEDVTKQFPDVVKFVKENIKSHNFIADSEVIGYDKKTKRFLPFQSISQRIRRKYNIEEMVDKIPVMVNLFDLIELDDKNLLKTPFEERRKLLKKITHEAAHKLTLAKQIVTSSVKEAEKFFKEALEKGNEGIMAKNLEAPYKPGSRVGYGVKIKPTMETLDLVVVAADWGEGKRAKWLSSFTIACRDKGEILEIGKVGTGFKEKPEEGLSFEEMTKLLKPLIKEQKGKNVVVKPKIVIEINYEEIQKSPTYNSGFALRFPRVVKLRPDKPVDEINTLKEIEEFYNKQRGKK